MAVDVVDAVRHREERGKQSILVGGHQARVAAMSLIWMARQYHSRGRAVLHLYTVNIVVFVTSTGTVTRSHHSAVFKIRTSYRIPPAHPPSHH